MIVLDPSLYVYVAAPLLEKIALDVSMNYRVSWFQQFNNRSRQPLYSWNNTVGLGLVSLS